MSDKEPKPKRVRVTLPRLRRRDEDVQPKTSMEAFESMRKIQRRRATLRGRYASNGKHRKQGDGS